MKTNEIDAASSSPVSMQDNAEGVGSLRAANRARQAEWCAGGDPEPDLSFRAVELAGEVGEACNVVKKLERERHGWRGSRATIDQLAEEIADVVICADLLAMTVGIDLDAAVIAKFNATSEKNGLSTRLSSSPVPSVDVGGDGNRLPQPTASGAAAGWMPTAIQAMTYEEAKASCHVRSAILRLSRPNVLYWKNHPEPLDERVPDADKLATDWAEHDPREGVGPFKLSPALAEAVEREAARMVLTETIENNQPPGWHFDRLCAIARELWTVETIDLHMCTGDVRPDYRGLLENWRVSWRRLEPVVAAALTASPAGDDPKALDAAARSSSTEAVEQEVERLREALTSIAAKARTMADNRMTAQQGLWEACAEEAEEALAPSLPGKEEGRG